MGRIVQSGFVFVRVIPCAISVEANGCSGSVLACNVALVVDASSPCANHAFSGRIAKRRTANRCWFLHASWNVASVSGGVLMFQGCCIKVFSRKQECPALSSAEAELCAMTENSKELVSLAMLLESIIDGIPLTILGTPECTTGTYQLLLRNDATAAISISSMEGLLRRVRHIELRARYIQMLVKRRRLILEHIPGLENPSDGLTKSFKTRDMLINLEREVGLVYGLDTNSFSWIKSFLNQLQSEEGENLMFVGLHQ